MPIRGSRLRLAIEYGIMMPMRTTLTLNDDLLKMARQKAARENRSLKDVINEAVRQGLTLGSRTKGPRFVFKLKTVAGRVMPGVDLHDRDKLFDLLDGR
jgi:hypothetical protein